MTTDTTAHRAQQLADEYADVLPPTIVTATVEAARQPDAAREDLDALADAVRRRASARPEGAR